MLENCLVSSRNKHAEALLWIAHHATAPERLTTVIYSYLDESGMMEMPLPSPWWLVSRYNKTDSLGLIWTGSKQ